jgi:hypothetical protein
MSAKIIPEENAINTELTLEVLVRPTGKTGTDWQEFDRGPGYIRIPAGVDVCVRVHNIKDTDLADLVPQLAGIGGLVMLNLAENRNMTDDGLEYLTALPKLIELNLSSCALTNTGLQQLKAFTRLQRLDLSYCNRLTDLCIKSLIKLRSLTYLDVKGCVKISNGGLSKLKRRGLTIRVT